MRKIAVLCIALLVVTAETQLAAQANEKKAGPPNAAAELKTETAAANSAANMKLAEEEALVSSENAMPPTLKGFPEKLMMYIPNRFLDLMDIFSIELKSGAAIGAGVRITRAFGLVGEVGATGDVVKGYNRQYGFALTQGYYGQILFPMIENMDRSITAGYVNKYWEYGANFPLPSDNVYARGTGAFDYWAIEAGATCFVGVKAALHPIAIYDFFAGLIFLDPSGDDVTLTPIVY